MVTSTLVKSLERRWPGRHVEFTSLRLRAPSAHSRESKSVRTADAFGPVPSAKKAAFVTLTVLGAGPMPTMTSHPAAERALGLGHDWILLNVWLTGFDERGSQPPRRSQHLKRVSNLKRTRHAVQLGNELQRIALPLRGGQHRSGQLHRSAAPRVWLWRDHACPGMGWKNGARVGR